MTRINPRTGARLVNHPPRFPVPPELLADIDAKAVQVIKLRQDVRDQDRHVRNLGHQASRVAAAADSAAGRGLRKMLWDQADQLRQTAGNARVRLSRMERTLADHEQALGELHTEARFWQSGEITDDDDEG